MGMGMYFFIFIYPSSLIYFYNYNPNPHFKYHFSFNFSFCFFMTDQWFIINVLFVNFIIATMIIVIFVSMFKYGVFWNINECLYVG